MFAKEEGKGVQGSRGTDEGARKKKNDATADNPNSRTDESPASG